MEKLNGILDSYGKVAIAFSGGVDSSFLLSAALRRLGSENVIALTVVPPYGADWELAEAKVFTAKLGVKHICIDLPMMEELKDNPPLRCYLCKKYLFTTMREEARRRGFPILADGSNDDDRGDYRPGMKALSELSINSPLLESGIGKEYIRKISKEWDLPTWDKPPYACLLTRIPHGQIVTEERLARIEAAELLLIAEGFPFVRVRDHDEIARIEIPLDRQIEFVQEGVSVRVDEGLKGLGYLYVSLDLGGYKMGHMNRKENNE